VPASEYIAVIARHFDFIWIDSEREPQCPPDPAYPDGKDVDASNGAAVTCHVLLPYPAPRCGAYIVDCRRCGLRLVVPVLGRADDARLIRVACKGLSPVGRA
jgi:hypothetical protein